MDLSAEDFRYKTKEEIDEHIKQSMVALYKKMIDEHFAGQCALHDGWLIWKLPNGVILKTTMNIPPYEGYIAAYYFDGKKENVLTHWHPMVEEIYDDLFQIHTGDIFWVIQRKSISKNLPLIMDKREWERFSDKKRRKYSVLS